MPTPVILVHRAGGVSGDWDEVRALLDERLPGRTVVAPDLPGKGRSGEDHPGSIEGLAEWVVDRIVEIAEGPAVLAGHSMGGAASIQAALDFPAWVRGLVIAGSSARMQIAQGMLEAIGDGRMREDREFVAEAFSPSMDPEARDRFAARMGRVPLSVLVADMEASAGLDVRGRLGDLSVPVRIVAGRDDRLVPVFNCMRLRDAIPGAGIKVVRDAGHMLPWEATEALASEIDAMVRRVEGGDA